MQMGFPQWSDHALINAVVSCNDEALVANKLVNVTMANISMRSHVVHIDSHS